MKVYYKAFVNSESRRGTNNFTDDSAAAENASLVLVLNRYRTWKEVDEGLENPIEM
jgi:hypothetical protein